MTDKNFLIKLNYTNSNFFSIEEGGNNFTTIFENENIHLLIEKQFFKDNSIVSPKSDTNLQSWINLVTNNLTKGLLILIEKTERKCIFYIDIFGFTPLFYKKETNHIILTNSVELINKKNDSISDESILDLILFHHHTLGSCSTKNILKLKGGHKLEVNENIVIQIEHTRIVDLFLNRFDFQIHTLKNIPLFLRNEISQNIKKEDPIFLTLTGGFDSRTLLSILLSNREKFQTVTWGGEGNIQNKISKKIASNYSINHKDIFLADSFINDIESFSQKAIAINIDNPMLLDMPQFVYMADCLETSNIITGFMGSEIIRGPSVSSQTTLTQVAAQLANSNSLDEFSIYTINYLTSLGIFNKEYLTQILPDYFQKFKFYYRKSSTSSERAIEFLFYEKYARLYRGIQNLHGDKHNIINPYLNQDFITTILNQKTSILNYNVFKTSSYDHFKFYKIYAEIIKSSFPSILQSRIDRGYLLKDLTSIKGYPFLVYHHLKNHVYGHSRFKYPKTLDYSNWMHHLVASGLQNSTLFDLPIFEKNKAHQLILKYQEGLISDELIKKKLIVLYGIHIWNNNSQL